MITIAAFSVKYSGIYGSVDGEWRSSLRCSIIGSLCVLSSEASCLFMVILTAFRLMNVRNPTAALTSSLGPWKLCIVAAWLLSFCFSIAPMLPTTSSYFVYSISFSSRFYQNGSIKVAQLKQFMCRYAILSKTTVKDYGKELESIEMFLKNNLPDSLPVRFGLYGESGACMFRFYVRLGDPCWEYIFILITFNMLCFVFIAIGNLKIYQRSTKSSANVRSNRSKQEVAKTQKRISLIIATNFCCWIPICIMAYMSLGGYDLSTSAVFAVTFTFLLQINSALNPFLFSSLPCLCKK